MQFSFGETTIIAFKLTKVASPPRETRGSRPGLAPGSLASSTSSCCSSWLRKKTKKKLNSSRLNRKTRGKWWGLVHNGAQHHPGAAVAAAGRWDNVFAELRTYKTAMHYIAQKDAILMHLTNFLMLYPIPLFIFFPFNVFPSGHSHHHSILHNIYAC